nr:MAG TPA: hypothetical protein [Caudoviricetes sp.]
MLPARAEGTHQMEHASIGAHCGRQEDRGAAARGVQ